MEVIKSKEKVIIGKSNFSILRYKLVCEKIDGDNMFGIILTEREKDKEERIYSAPSFTNNDVFANKLFDVIVEGLVTGDSFYDILEDFSVC